MLYIRLKCKDECILKYSRNGRKKWLKAVETRKTAAWVDAILPYNIAVGPVSILIQLLILNLNGTVIDVAFAVALFSGIGIPAALVWGSITDRFQRRKKIIVTSYLATAVILVSFLFANTGYLVSLLYTVFSFVNSD
jgi:MFS family permease